MSDQAHETITPERRAAMMAQIIYDYPSRAWSALYRPLDYVFDQRDHMAAVELDLRCSELRDAFERTTDWRTTMMQLERLIRLEDRRRRMSIGVRIDGRVIYGEAL